MLTGDARLARAVYVGLLNEGVLVQTKVAGALGIMTREQEIDALVDAFRRVVARVH